MRTDKHRFKQFDELNNYLCLWPLSVVNAFWLPYFINDKVSFNSLTFASLLFSALNMVFALISFP